MISSYEYHSLIILSLLPPIWAYNVQPYYIHYYNMVFVMLKKLLLPKQLHRSLILLNKVCFLVFFHNNNNFPFNFLRFNR